MLSFLFKLPPKAAHNTFRLYPTQRLDTCPHRATRQVGKQCPLEAVTWLRSSRFTLDANNKISYGEMGRFTVLHPQGSVTALPRDQDCPSQQTSQKTLVWVMAAGNNHFLFQEPG